MEISFAIDYQDEEGYKYVDYAMTKEEADDIASLLKEEGYSNITINKIRL